MRFTFGFPSIAGILFNLPSIFQSIKWVLDWKGRYDAASSLREAGGPMTDLLAAIPPWFYPVALFAGIGLIWWDSKRPTREITVSISPLATAVVVTLLALGTWGWFFYDRSRGPIIWTWNENNPLSIGRSGDVYGIYAFSFTGFNRSNEPISKIKAFIQSKITGEVTPLGFAAGQLIPAEKVVIPPEVKFFLHAVLPGAKDGAGISFDNFRKDFSRFTFSFEYEGGKFVKTFDEAEVNQVIAESYRVQQELYKQTAASFNPSGIRILP
jgi:hypothetical protein